MGFFVRLFAPKVVTNAPVVGTGTQVFWKNHEKLKKDPEKVSKNCKNFKKFGKIKKNAPL